MPHYIGACLKYVSITLYCQLFSTDYQAVRIENYLKSNSTTKLATMNNAALHNVMLPQNRRLLLSAKINDTKEDTYTKCTVHTLVCQNALFRR